MAAMTALVVRRAVLDYARRPLNLVLLVAVPVVMVLALGGQLASFSKLLSATTQPAHLDVATAGWAAAAVAGLAGFFQAIGSRATDRRLAAASAHGATPVVAGRLAAALALALAAATAAITALGARSGITDPARVLSAIVLVAMIYVAIGVVVGTMVRSEMNGALAVSVIWMLDVFVGAGLGGSSSVITRFFPLHFPTMVLTSQAAHHAGPVGDVGWSLVWTAGVAVLAVSRLASTTRVARPAQLTPTAASVPTAPLSRAATTTAVTASESPTPQHRTEERAQVPVPTAIERRTVPASPTAAALSAAVREYRRNRVLWVLLITVPVLFIALAAQETPTKGMPVTLVHGARQVTTMLSLRQVHAAEMASVASALLAGVAGLFVVTGSADGDRRLVLAGFRPRQILAGHLGVIAGAAVLTSAVSLAVSAAWLSPHDWVEYAAADLLIALTYAMVGVLLGPIVGRLGGLYLILLLAIVDVGYGQTVMFHPLPPGWGAFLPARGAGRLMIDGAFTSSFEQYGHLLLGLGWLAALTLAAGLTFRHQTGARLTPPRPRGRQTVADAPLGPAVVSSRLGTEIAFAHREADSTTSTSNAEKKRAKNERCSP
jgi:hypothetical protein